MRRQNSLQSPSKHGERSATIKEVLNVLVDSDLTYEEAVNVLVGCRTYLRHNLKIENIDLQVEEREPF